MRFVLDLNIIISGFISRAKATAQLIKALRYKRVILITSHAQLDERADVASRLSAF